MCLIMATKKFSFWNFCTCVECDSFSFLTWIRLHYDTYLQFKGNCWITFPRKKVWGGKNRGFSPPQRRNLGMWRDLSRAVENKSAAEEIVRCAQHWRYNFSRKRYIICAIKIYLWKLCTGIVSLWEIYLQRDISPKYISFSWKMSWKIYLSWDISRNW